MSVNESLARNCYHPAESSHITLRGSLSEQQAALLEKICPAGLFQRDAGARVRVNFQGCLECGCCRLIAGSDAIAEWDYPPSGSGVSLRFG
ncbi:ferredoxin family protein [Enterobacter chengduensis]|uniref:ferredoxin family protein n=1 Tax=Enterobacter chengduensis TaxID=2494701 RepID=UPI0020038758|nr:4Fe-4S dicluster domain-containing protein [Enterobacter chengduensis]MCK7452354.1 4Fe-4S dicluster domain-containing protein [Enterobacter chengduensis]